MFKIPPVILLIVACSVRVSAQTAVLSPQVIASGGGQSNVTFGSVGLINISYTFGETFISTITAGSGTVQTFSQGFHQPEATSKEISSPLQFYHGFTPNGDNVNDVWVIDGVEDLDVTDVSIYNRWGNLVWQTADYDNMEKVWDGTSNGKKLPDATYFYVIQAAGQTYKGWIELTR